MSDKLKIKFGILCEDVRREDNGKIFALGIFGSNIVFSELPTPVIFFQLLLFATLIEDTKVKLKVTIYFDGEEVNRGSMDVDAKGGANAVFAVPVPIKIEKPGLLSIDVAAGDGKPVRVVEDMPISQGTPNAS